MNNFTITSQWRHKDRPLEPRVGKGRWDPDYLSLPCSFGSIHLSLFFCSQFIHQSLLIDKYGSQAISFFSYDSYSGHELLGYTKVKPFQDYLSKTNKITERAIS